MRSDVALVTGAGGGQGAAVARALAEDGFTVGLVDVDEPRLAATADEIRLAGARAAALPADVSDPAAVEAVFAELEAAFGPPRVVAAVAAVLAGSFVVDATPDYWRRITEVNLFGVVNVGTAAARRMIAAGDGGRILTWSSVSVTRAAPGYAAYVATKAAVEGFSRTLAIELAPHGITVNVIRPGSIETPMMAAFDADAREAVARDIPLGRWGTSGEIADLVRFLVSPGARWMTGTCVTVDGGVEAAAGSAPLEAVRRRLARESQPARPAPG